ncbi:eCIS core domain-containing protein [Pseudomonas syringae]|uniref:eCIS core domain-containing protein n=1 Tax=Pseudomonas syringae TaxID=317 RepID=UPI001F45AB90|nr:DUF4157 domain-containing protein [Pseudomonas syringae]MCF5604479.1 DUF4157 domain-containing protein [Pseudomonas syringae]
MSELAPPSKKSADSAAPAATQQRQSAAVLQDNRTSPVQAKAAPTPNRTGMPDPLKNGIEHLSGMNMDHVRVHFNSDKPAQLNAHAYAQGSQIHLAPGQEKHLPHEAWHVVQQKVKSEKNNLFFNAASGPTIVQRVVTEGELNFEQLVAEYNFSPTETAILAAWEASPTLHHFESGKVFNALKAAEIETKRVASEEGEGKLFSQNNHKFSTQAPDRLPTLYFNTEGHAKSGRLRQQHSSGPLAKINNDGHVDYFFENQADSEKFRSDLKSTKDKKSIVENLSSYNGGLQAKAGYFHVETSNGKNGRPHGITHRSGGVVVMDGGSHSDQVIDKIHGQITGEIH